MSFFMITSRQNVVLFLMVPLLLLTYPVRLQAQNNEILNYVSGEIPVNNQNWDISQDPVSGYIYFANSAGLVEYNGISSKTYQMPFRQGIRSVYINSSGKIFSGSFEDFGFWQKDDEKGLVYQSLTRNLTIPKNDEIWKIYETNGTVYFQSFTTIYKTDSDSVVPLTAPAAMLFMFRAGDKFIVQVLGQGSFLVRWKRIHSYTKK